MKIHPFRRCRCSNHAQFSEVHSDLYNSSFQSLQGSTSTETSVPLNMATFDSGIHEKATCGSCRSKESQSETHTHDKPKSTLSIRRFLIPVLGGSRAFGKRKSSAIQKGYHQGLLQAMSRVSSMDISMQQTHSEAQLRSSSTDMGGDSGESNGLSNTEVMNSKEQIDTDSCLVYQFDDLQELSGSVHGYCCKIATCDSRSIMDVDDPTIADILEALGDYEDFDEKRETVEAIIRASNDSSDQEYAIPVYITRNTLKPFQMPLSFWPNNSGYVGTDRSIISTVALIECESQDSSQKSIHHSHDCLIGWEPWNLANERKKGKEDKATELVTGGVSKLDGTTNMSISPMLFQGTSLHCLERQIIKGAMDMETEPLESHAYSGPGSHPIILSPLTSCYFGMGDVSLTNQGIADASSGTTHSMSYSQTVTIEDDEQQLQLQPTDLSWLTSRRDDVPSPEFTVEPNRPFIHIAVSTANDVNKEQQGGSVIRKSGRAQQLPYLHDSTRVKQDSAAPSDGSGSTGSLSIVAAAMKIFNMEAAAYIDQAPTRAPPSRSPFPRHQHPHEKATAMSRMEFPKCKSTWHADRPLTLYSPLGPSQNRELMTGTVQATSVCPPSTESAGAKAEIDKGPRWNAVKKVPAQQQFAELVEWPTNESPIQQITNPQVRHPYQGIREEPPVVAATTFEASQAMLPVPTPMCPEEPCSRSPSTGAPSTSKFLFFEQQDAIRLHKPMPVRATYDFVSFPVAKEILQGPQGPASLIHNRLIASHVSATASIQDRFRQVEQLLSKQECVLGGEELLSESRDVSYHDGEGGDSDRAQRRGSVQSYWEKRIASSSPIIAPDPSKFVPETSAATKSRIVPETSAGVKSRMLPGHLTRGSSVTSAEYCAKTAKSYNVQFNGEM